VKTASPQPPHDTSLLLAALGELSAPDLAALEQRAATDAALRQRLQAIRADVNATDALFTTLDDVPAAMVNRAAANASASVRQWQAQRQSQVAPPAARRSRWPQIGAVAAALLLLAAGGLVYRNWTAHSTQNLALRTDESGLPSIPPETEEGNFHLDALKRLAEGSEGVDWNERIAADMPASALPPVTLDDSNGGIASAVATGEPFFDVPLSPDIDSGK
jgi:hypothetical protein